MFVIIFKFEVFLKVYFNNVLFIGFEVLGQQLWLEYIKFFIDEWQLDNYGIVYGVINFGQDYKVVIEGYVDEIFWFVYYILDDGFINVICNGGFDYMIVFFKWVNIYIKKGIV